MLLNPQITACITVSKAHTATPHSNIVQTLNSRRQSDVMSQFDFCSSSCYWSSDMGAGKNLRKGGGRATLKKPPRKNKQIRLGKKNPYKKKIVAKRVSYEEKGLQ